VNILLRRQAKFRVAAWAVQANQAKVHAAIGLAVAARVAMSAADHRFDDHQVVAPEAAYFGPDLGHDAADFVTGPGSERARLFIDEVVLYDGAIGSAVPRK
jgi:hypothetical protein